MTIFLSVLGGLVAGFIFGVLFGRKNKKKVEKIVTTLRDYDYSQLDEDGKKIFKDITSKL